MTTDARHSWFKRLLLPGLGFKAVVIGGGYATGRELAEFFLSAGPRGGLLAILLATILFSLLCALLSSPRHILTRDQLLELSRLHSTVC